MTDFRIPDLLEVHVAESVCEHTMNGWLQYCDNHDTHGNADTEEEAQICAAAHEAFWFDVSDDDPECDLMVWQRTQHERLG